jgi:hypothetical protein
LNNFWVGNEYNWLMDLRPNEPPGHASRKLRGYLGEIERLRAEGYTIRAIHEALRAAGIEVSWASVQRELARSSDSPKAPGKANQVPQKLSAVPEPSSPVRHGSPDLNQFFDQHNSNPLFKKRST